MFRSSNGWSWLLALIALFVTIGRYFAGTDGIGSGGGYDDWTPIPDLNCKNVERYSLVGCTDQEIADRFLVDVDYVRREFKPVLRATRGLRAYRLRYAQTKLALDGNGPMLNWLGRNGLGQSNNASLPGTDDPDPDQ
jgi:hypothetical protein